MKKSLLLLLILTVMLALTLGSCNKSDTDTEQNPGESTENGGNTDDNTDSGKNEDNTPEHTHEYTDWTEISAPDCENEGTERGQCSCGETSERAIAALGHTSGDWIVESVPTETSDGYKYKTCTRCGEKTKEKIIEYVENPGLLYEVNADGTTCTVTGIGSFAGTELEIPEYIEGHKVTSIGDWAFWGCRSLTSVVIPEGVTSIGEYAFYDCSAFTSIVIPDSVTSIGECTFSYCSSLTSIVIPEGVTSIGDDAFFGCTSLASITVDANNPTYKSIDGNLYTKDGKTLIQYAFGKADDSFTIPDGVTSIGSYAFSGCSSLTSIVIPEGVTYVGDYAFYGCSSLDGIVIPEGVTSIGNYAFSSCSSLTSIVIPDSVTSIGNWAFADCISFTSIAIPEGVTSIGDSAFFGCTSLASITVDANNPTYKSIDGNLYTKDGKILIQYAICKADDSFVIPDGVTFIENYAFWGCSSLTSIVIPDSVTYIGTLAFWGCSALTSISIDANNPNYKSIDGNLYTKDGKTLIQYAVGKADDSFVIPDGVTYIEEWAFHGCRYLASVVMPDSVTSIGNYAFYGCSSLTDVYYTGSEAEWAEISIGDYNDYLTGAKITYNYVPEN